MWEDKVESRSKSQIVADFSPRSHGFEPSSVFVGLLVGKVSVGRVFRQVLQIFPVITIPHVFRIHSQFNYSSAV